MEEEVLMYLEDAADRMKKAVIHLENELIKIRAGKATPQMLETVTVEYYGNHVPLSQVANINTPDPKTILIQPWEKAMMDPINKSILAANLGFTPIPQSDVLRITLPPLTEERRKQMVKQLGHEGEVAKVSIRNTRRDTIEEIKKLQKSGLAEDAVKENEDKVQKLTDEYSKKVELVLQKKEKDIMTV